MLLITGAAALLHQSIDATSLARATAHWKERLRTDSGDAEAVYALGMLYLQSGLRDVAITHLRRAVELTPEAALARYNLAQALLSVSDAAQIPKAHQEAREQIEFCLNLDPDFKEAASWREVFLAVDRLNVPAESVRLCYSAVCRCPDIPELYENYAYCLLTAGHFAEALQTAQTGIGLNPKSAFSPGRIAFAMHRFVKHAAALP